jgi:RNA polymerase sigma factor (sigma-70 family)
MTTPANDNRPTTFDARLMSYYPHLKRLAFKLTNNKTEQEDILNESIVYILSHWTSFRPTGGFYNWITLCMRHVAQNGRRKQQVRSRHMSIVSDERALLNCAVQPSQLESMELSSILADMGGRGGGALLHRAMGHTLDEVGAQLGVGRERARQITERERLRLRAAA